MDTSKCSSCCSRCALEMPQNCTSGMSKASPFALDKLIAAGTLVLPLDPDGEGVKCNHGHLEDGWHSFSGNQFLQQLSGNAELLCREIDFLITHRFIIATYRLPSSSLHAVLRIYLIPFDLPNVQGQLRIRKEAVLSPARRFLKNLLSLVIQDHDSWNLGLYLQRDRRTLMPINQDSRTLSEIYSCLKFPNPQRLGSEEITGRLLDFRDNLDGLGLRSTLYKYQRQSVAAMILKELDTKDIPDPLFIPLQSMDCETFFWQPGTMEILRERPTVAASCNGILCEELGTGKTIMVLSLILATVHRISTPEESITHDRPILTPLSFRCFPSPDCTSARKPFLRRGNTLSSHDLGVPSLVEILLHRINTIPDTRIFNTSLPTGTAGKNKKDEFSAKLERLPLFVQRCKNTPFYLHYQDGMRSQRKTTDLGPKKMYLTSATLIIVPPNLLSQWDREIHKHCEYPLRTLILRTGTPMPDAASLALDYDIILMNYKRFTIENNYSNTEKLHTWRVCHCSSLPDSRIPDCQCKAPKVSPLLQVRWKRLVIDEGHISASLSSVLTPFTKLLSVERRWIVTGTPTTNLLGLSLGSKINGRPARNQVEADDSEELEADPATPNQSYSSLVSTPRSASPSSSPVSSLQTFNSPPRTWTKYDRQDLGKLGKMISHFIQVPQFTASPKLITTHIIEPLLDAQGPRPGAIQVLNQIMEMTMIRHRIEDVEKEVILPPMHHESILLDLDPYVVKSYNAMQAAIAINAVDSQRTDQDYMFHLNNIDALQMTVKNMSQLMFWSADDAMYNVDELVKNAEDHFKNASQRNVSPEDLRLLTEAFKHIETAARDPLWRAMQHHEDIPYRVMGIDREIFQAWSRIRLTESSHNPAVVGFVHTDRLLKLQDLAIRRPRISIDGLVDIGKTVAANDLLVRQLYINSQRRKGSRSAAVRPHHDEINAGMKAEDAAKQARDPNRLKEMKKDLEIAIERLNNYENDESNSEPSLASGNPYESLVKSIWLGDVRLGSTVSSKLNYIINEVLQYSADEKFLIFSDSELSLAHIGEALQLMRVKFLRFTTQIDPRRREEMVLTFETSTKYRVFLMELKHGARGLNLVSASRVIFCEPVWQADVESQAIKRAHRIGQTRSITVKTLAIRGTAEENMVSRRNLLKDSQGKLPKLIEEAGMRHFIANPKFITYAPERYATVEIPFLPPQTSDASISNTSPTKRARSIEVLEATSDSPTKKPRTVRFASIPKLVCCDTLPCSHSASCQDDSVLIEKVP